MEFEMATSTIPTVDLSPFFNGDDEKDLMTRALKLAEVFMEYAYEEKIGAKPMQGAPLPAGYSKQPDHSADKNEYLLMFPPGSPFNVFPTNPPQLREVMEEMFSHLVKIGRLIESIVNECLGLPPNFLHEYNQDRSWDYMVALRYYPALKEGCNGLSEHEDGNCFTFVIQDQVGGLEVRKNGEWIPVVPTKGIIVVNISDVIQV